MDSSAAIAAPRPRLAEAARAVLAEARTDRWLYVIVAAYLIGGWIAALALGRGGVFVPFLYLPLWLQGLAAYLAAFLVVADLPGAVKDNPASPMSAFAARVRRRVTPRFFAGVLLFAAAGVFYGAFTSLKNINNAVFAFHADVMLANLDAAIHGGVDPWKLLQPVLGHHWVTRAVQHVYLAGWTFFLLAGTAAAALSARFAPVRAQFFVTYFLAWILLGNIVAPLFMSGGPVYYAELTSDPERFEPLMAYLSFSDGMVNSSVVVRDLLWSLHGQSDLQLGAGISAFPSLHVAMATLFAITAFRVDQRLGWLMAAFAGVIMLGSVHLGWHYAVDGYVSAIVVAALWFGVGALLGKLRPAA